MPLNYGKGTCCSRFSHSKQGFQLRRLWSYNQSAPNQSAATGCCFVRVVFWVFVCFGSFVLFGQAHVLTLLLRIRHGDLCLSAHIAPLPVQKKTKPKRCKHCGKSGHVASDCWEKHPDKRLSKNTKNTGADTGKKPFPSGKVFCASRGAMCAGSAQVTLVELRKSFYTGCKPAKAKNPKTNTTPKHKTTRGEATCCATRVAMIAV